MLTIILQLWPQLARNGLKSALWTCLQAAYPARGAKRGSHQPALSGQQDMQAFEVPGQTDQTPLARRGSQASQRELAKTQHLFDNADDRLDGTFA